MNKELIFEISRIHEMMGIKTNIHKLLLEWREIFGVSGREYTQETTEATVKQEFRNMVEDLSPNYGKNSLGKNMVYDDFVELGKRYAKSAGEDITDEAAALSYFFREAGSEAMKDYQRVFTKMKSKDIERAAITLEANAVENAKKALIALKQDMNRIRTGLDDGTLDLPTVKTIIDDVATFMKNQPTTAVNKAMKEALIPEMEAMSKQLDDFDKVLPEAGTSKSGTNFAEELEQKQLQDLFDQQTQKYKVDPELDPNVKTPEVPILGKTSKQVEKPTEKFATPKTLKQKIGQKYGNQLKNKITNSLQQNAKTKTVTLDETFGDNPLIFDPTKKGQPGWTEDGLKQEFADYLEKKEPGLVEKVKKGEYKYRTDEEGNWDQLNMLNTNSGDRTVLLEDFATQRGKNLNDLTNQEMEDLMTDFLNMDNLELQKLILNNKQRYTTNSTKNAIEGDRIESNFDQKFKPGGELENFGVVVFKPQGRGNPLDFKGYDRIILKNGEFVPLQIKKASSPIKQGESIVFPGQENFSFYLMSGVRLKDGFVGVEDVQGKWIIYPPQAQFDKEVITKVNKETGTPEVATYTLKTKNGQTVKEFKKTSGYTYVDISSKPGDEFITNIDFK